jgi:hypothetical protein
MSYCPKCKSVLAPADNEYIEKAGVCSYCVTYDNTPDKRFRAKFDEAPKVKVKPDWKKIYRKRKFARS